MKSNRYTPFRHHLVLQLPIMLKLLTWLLTTFINSLYINILQMQVIPNLQSNYLPLINRLIHFFESKINRIF